MTTNSLHPGVIVTELTRHFSVSKPFPSIVFWMMYVFKGILFKSIVQGAQTTIHCAVAEELNGVTGKYFR